MDTIFPDYEEQKPKRSTFLTVLCILTFIGSTYSVVTNSITLADPAKAAAEARKGSQQMNQSPDASPQEKAIIENMAKSIEAAFTPEKIRNSSAGTVLAGLLCLAGAFLMWRLNKKGFWLYVAGTVIGIALPFALFGNNLIGILATVIVGFVGIVFCIMYAVNLKQMR